MLALLLTSCNDGDDISGVCNDCDVDTPVVCDGDDCDDDTPVDCDGDDCDDDPPVDCEGNECDDDTTVVCDDGDCDDNASIIECEGEVYTAPFYVFYEERRECGYLLFADFGSPHLFHGHFIWTGDFDLPEEFRERYLPVMVTFCLTERSCGSYPVVDIFSITLNIKEDNER